MMDDIQFEVGEKYENMKGVFEVVAMRKESMDIRWENGEEISTPIDLQQRIIERMQHEKEMEEAEALKKAKKAKGASSKAGKQFSGLEENDFNSSVSKTSWRGRGQLGGAVAQRLKSKQFKFNSWAVLRKAEVNWIDVKRQKQPDLALQAKFYARIENDHLCYGIHLPVPDPSTSANTDWQTFTAWLAKPENDAWLNKQCNTHQLYLCDSGKQGFGGVLEANDGGWVHVQQESKDVIVESLNDFLALAAKPGKLDLRIEKRMGQPEAVEKKQHITDDLATLFETLMPIYVALASRSV